MCYKLFIGIYIPLREAVQQVKRLVAERAPLFFRLIRHNNRLLRLCVSLPLPLSTSFFLLQWPCIHIDSQMLNSNF